MGKYFGTDGIRGRANRPPITPDVAMKVGMAAGLVFTKGDHRHRVVIGKDTRLSSYMIENALTAGFLAVGVDVLLTGPVPTPGIAMLTRGMCADLAGSGIQVNALAPGYFATELTRALVDDPEFSAWVAKRTPAGRWGETRELVGTLLFLASPASDFVNGQVIFVDGGMTAVV